MIANPNSKTWTRSLFLKALILEGEQQCKSSIVMLFERIFMNFSREMQFFRRPPIRYFFLNDSSLLVDDTGEAINNRTIKNLFSVRRKFA